jgi:hypothetical protein
VQDSRVEKASLSRSVIRVPYDPKGFNQDDMLQSYNKKGKSGLAFNWASNRKHREAFSVMETGTSGLKQFSMLRGEDIIMEVLSEDDRKHLSPIGKNKPI